ncbi:MAG: Mur ligase family protein, partial [Lentimicrobiaceae bacterium]|nr:Mur ligase family protein [Lentimicrobiaceae bacterium]
MKYKQVLDYMYSQLPMFQRIGAAAYKASLDNTIAISNLSNHPYRNFQSIHIAGTNGKGSVSHMLASIMQEANLKTGLYTSPHLRDFRERMKINGSMIPREYVIEYVEQHMEDFNRIKPSFFEMTFGMAMQWFSDSKVDIAIIETGMGGRLDSTNVITPILSVITNIGMDHMQFLGSGLPEIAREKAGIIKPEVPVVIGETLPESIEIFKDT